jgi:hypothetical protein
MHTSSGKNDPKEYTVGLNNSVDISREGLENPAKWEHIERAIRDFRWGRSSHFRDGEVFYGMVLEPSSRKPATPFFNSESALDGFLRRTQYR